MKRLKPAHASFRKAISSRVAGNETVGSRRPVDAMASGGALQTSDEIAVRGDGLERVDSGERGSEECSLGSGWV